MRRTLPQTLFFIIRPFFSPGQWLVQSLGFMREAKTVEGPYRRQPYLVTRFDQGQTSQAIARLLATGFRHEPIALNEYGQIASMRRLDEAQPDRQYHVRVFEDGEVRGHYELTPEDHPVGHWNERVFEQRNETFLAALSSDTLRP